MKALIVSIFCLAFASCQAQEFKKGDKVKVLWSRGEWLPATVLDVSKIQYQIHLDGQSDAHTQWVAKADVKGLPKNSKTTVKDGQPAEIKTNTTGSLGNECGFEPPSAKFTKLDGFSEGLAKRNLYDKYGWKANGTINAPLRVGVVFVDFKALAPYKNTVRNDPARGALRLNDAAPPNVMIYPVKSKHIVCEEYTTGITRIQVEGEYDCFKDRSGDWVCGSSGKVPPKTTSLD